MAGVSCSDSETGTITTAQENAQEAQRLSLVPSTTLAQTDLRLYYNEAVFRVMVTRLSRQTAATVLASGAPISKIFTVAELSHPQPYYLVLDSNNNGAAYVYCMIYLIKFEDDYPPRQFYSMAAIDAAIGSGEIMVENTERLHKCLFL